MMIKHVRCYRIARQMRDSEIGMWTLKTQWYNILRSVACRDLCLVGIQSMGLTLGVAFGHHAKLSASQTWEGQGRSRDRWLGQETQLYHFTLVRVRARPPLGNETATWELQQHRPPSSMPPPGIDLQGTAVTLWRLRVTAEGLSPNVTHWVGGIGPSIPNFSVSVRRGGGGNQLSHSESQVGWELKVDLNPGLTAKSALLIINPIKFDIFSMFSKDCPWSLGTCLSDACVRARTAGARGTVTPNVALWDEVSTHPEALRRYTVQFNEMAFVFCALTFPSLSTQKFKPVP